MDFNQKHSLPAPVLLRHDYLDMAPRQELGSLISLPDDIKTRIFRFADREACAAYIIAIGGEVQEEKYILKGLLREPFTYWDWHGTTESGPDNDDKAKRRLLWDRQKGYQLGDGSWAAYPSPRRRWTALQHTINDNNRHFVKRIALAHWMETADFSWVSQNLPGLEALDLSDIQHAGASAALGTDEAYLPDWSTVVTALESSKKFFAQLKWLGLSNCTVKGSPGGDAFNLILPRCENLEILSIRADYHPKVPGYRSRSQAELAPADLHASVCNLILRIIDNIPDTAATIELRQYIDFLPYFVQKLQMHKPSVKRIGIDLGAWIQVYPLGLNNSKPRACSKRLSQEEMDDAVDGALEWAVESVRATHAREGDEEPLTLSTGDRSKGLEEGDPSFDHSSDQYNVNRIAHGESVLAQHIDVGHGHDGVPLNQCRLDAWPDHSQTREMHRIEEVDTLLRMLVKVHDVGAKYSTKFFPLDPEPLNKSNEPIHPFALLQFEGPLGVDCGPKYHGVDPTGDYSYVFNWLNETFKWRPVIDWDCFVLPEKMAETLPGAFEHIVNDHPNYMDLMKHMFQRLKKAKIPVHLLIGKTGNKESSCYWGWPYDEQGWQEWLDSSFDAGLDKIAELVDSLDIFYELRNPIPSPWLEDIERLESYRWPHAPCPAVPCPWPGGEGRPLYGIRCPFRSQRKPLASTKTKDNQSDHKIEKGRIRSGRSAISTGYEGLANSCTAAPNAGQNANDNTESDTDDEIKSNETKPSLHHLARQAVFARESVGWQRFWATYSLKFENLTMVRIRMPHVFDYVASWRLATLLNPKIGWQLLLYTDERQHLQTLEENTYAHSTPYMPESPLWPAGRFVRRSWLYPYEKPDLETARDHNNVTMPGKPTLAITKKHGHGCFDEDDWKNTERHEAKELYKASTYATRATERYLDARARVSSEQQEEAIKMRIERIDVYRADVEQALKSTWDRRLNEYIVSFESRQKGKNILGAEHSDSQRILTFLRQLLNTETPYELLGFEEDVDYSIWHNPTRAVGWIPFNEDSTDRYALAPSSWSIDYPLVADVADDVSTLQSIVKRFRDEDDGTPSSKRIQGSHSQSIAVSERVASIIAEEVARRSISSPAASRADGPISLSVEELEVARRRSAAALLDVIKEVEDDDPTAVVETYIEEREVTRRRTLAESRFVEISAGGMDVIMKSASAQQTPEVSIEELEAKRRTSGYNNYVNQTRTNDIVTNKITMNKIEMNESVIGQTVVTASKTLLANTDGREPLTVISSIEGEVMKSLQRKNKLGSIQEKQAFDEPPPLTEFEVDVELPQPTSTRTDLREHFPQIVQTLDTTHMTAPNASAPAYRRWPFEVSPSPELEAEPSAGFALEAAASAFEQRDASKSVMEPAQRRVPGAEEVAVTPRPKQKYPMTPDSFRHFDHGTSRASSTRESSVPETEFSTAKQLAASSDTSRPSGFSSKAGTATKSKDKQASHFSYTTSEVLETEDDAEGEQDQDSDTHEPFSRPDKGAKKRASRQDYIPPILSDDEDIEDDAIEEIKTKRGKPKKGVARRSGTSTPRVKKRKADGSVDGLTEGAAKKQKAMSTSVDKEKKAGKKNKVEDPLTSPVGRRTRSRMKARAERV